VRPAKETRAEAVAAEVPGEQAGDGREAEPAALVVAAAVA